MDDADAPLSIRQIIKENDDETYLPLFDLDDTPPGSNQEEGLDDIYDQDSDSVWGRDSGTGAGNHGVMLTALTFAISHSTQIQEFTDYVSDRGNCTASPVATSPPVLGDFSGRVTYNLGTLSAGASKTAQVLYRRF